MWHSVEMDITWEDSLVKSEENFGDQHFILFPTKLSKKVLPEGFKNLGLSGNEVV